MATFGLLLLAVGAFSIFVYSTTLRNLNNNRWVDHTYQVLDTANVAMGSLVDMETGLRGFMIGGADAFLEPYEGGRAQYQESIAELKELTSDNPEQVARWEQIGERVVEWEEQISTPAIELRRRVNAGTIAFDELAAFASRPDGKQIFDRIRTIFAEATGAEDALLQVRLAETAESSRWLLRITLWGSLGIVAGGLALSYLFSGSLAKPLERTAGELAMAAEGLGSVAGQVSSSSQSLSQGASEQAASIEETSASLEELSGMARSNGGHAEKARQTAATARESADAGAVQVQALQSAMSAIEVAGNEITKILRTIDDIAFQTNILALNASVEAARAGEHGAGFAVVAEEVRSLAKRSSQAAAETAVKIEDSLQKSQEGTRASNEVARQIGIIQEEVRQLDDLVKDIAAATSEQSQGIGQIGMAMQQVDRVTQTNASSAEETAAAAEELNRQAVEQKRSVERLIGLVRGFDGQGTDDQAAARRSAEMLRFRRSSQNGHTRSAHSLDNALADRDEPFTFEDQHEGVLRGRDSARV